MQVFLDTSVLVAASESSHPRHAQALPVLRRVAKGEDQGEGGPSVSTRDAGSLAYRSPLAPPSRACFGRAQRSATVAKHPAVPRT